MISRSFQDFDAFASTVRDVDCEMLLQNPQRHLWTIDQTKVAGIDVQYGRVGSGNIVQGQSWSNGFLLYLPVTATVEYSTNGIVVDKHAVAVFEPGCDFCISTKVAHDWCSLFIPTEILVGGSAVLGSSSAQSFAEARRCYVTGENPEVANRFVSAVKQVLFTSRTCPRFEDSPAAESAAVELMTIALSFVSNGRVTRPRQEGRPKIQRRAIIRRCIDLLEERDDQSVSVEEMAVACHVSERTLRTAFNEYFAASPARYFKVRKLNRIHRSLRVADPAEVSVTDILVDHGVWEFGRCAAQYRQLFGELPSQTLKKGSRGR